jgi:hypothetical protein
MNAFLGEISRLYIFEGSIPFFFYVSRRIRNILRALKCGRRVTKSKKLYKPLPPASLTLLTSPINTN